MDWVGVAEEFCGKHGWGVRGKQFSVSRMFSQNDMSCIGRGQWVASHRPRGILSGFLAIVPILGYAVYLPPVSSISRSGGPSGNMPRRIRMQLSDRVLSEGALFSAYITRANTMVLEDVLVWENKPVWCTQSFSERWGSCMKQFLEREWIADLQIQGMSIEFAKYTSIANVVEPDTHHVVEFVPYSHSTKRLIWIPSREGVSVSLPPPPPLSPPSPLPLSQSLPSPVVTPVAPPSESLTSTSPALPTSSVSTFYAKKEAGMGPDVYAVWQNGERLGVGLVRTLAVSRALRLANKESLCIHAIYNKQFEKWEIHTVLENQHA